MSASALDTTKRKTIFDLVRRLMRRRFRQSEVNRLDSVLDRVLKNGDSQAIGLHADSQQQTSHLAETPGSRRSRGGERILGQSGTALIKRFEGCARLRRDGLVEAYPDPGTGSDPWTIGWGATGIGLKAGEWIGPGTVWTQQDCDDRLARDLDQFAKDVTRAIGDAPTSDAQFDALVSFHYNTGAIHRATLTRKHKAGDFEGAAKEFARWNKAGGKVLKGLVRRRSEEAKLYASG